MNFKLTSKKFVDFVGIEKYSSFSKLVRIVAYVFRFVNNRVLHRHSKERTFGELSRNN